MRTRIKQEGERIQTISWVWAGGGRQREMEGERQMSGEPEAATRNNSKGIAASLTGSCNIPNVR